MDFQQNGVDMNHKEAIAKARKFENFVHENTRGTHMARTYAIMSYIAPIYVYDKETGKWFGNSHKYSRTTSKHQTMYRPDDVHQYVDKDTIYNIAIHGFADTIGFRME